MVQMDDLGELTEYDGNRAVLGAILKSSICHPAYFYPSTNPADYISSFLTSEADEKNHIKSFYIAYITLQ